MYNKVNPNRKNKRIMITLESLNRTYEKLSNWENQYRISLMEYLDKGLAFCNGKAELKFKYNSYEEAEKDEEEFDEQFPVCVVVEDRHGFSHSTYVTALYKVGNLYYVDGYDTSDGEWIKGWYTDDMTNTYEQLAYFIHNVLNPSDDEDSTSDEITSDENILVGYQIVDEDNFLPEEFGNWDVFRTSEDAEAYRDENLSPEGYSIIEEWASPQQVQKYHYHSLDKRTFKKHEKVWIAEEFHNRYATVVMEVETKWADDRILITELNTGDEIINNSVRNGKVFQKVKGKYCPKCDSPLYKGYPTKLTNHLYCPECGSEIKD